MRDMSSEQAMFMILEFGAYAKIPLDDKLKNLKMPVLFLYGEDCHISRLVPLELIEKNELKEGSMLRIVR